MYDYSPFASPPYPKIATAWEHGKRPSHLPHYPTRRQFCQTRESVINYTHRLAATQVLDNGPARARGIVLFVGWLSGTICAHRCSRYRSWRVDVRCANLVEDSALATCRRTWQKRLSVRGPRSNAHAAPIHLVRHRLLRVGAQAAASSTSCQVEKGSLRSQPLSRGRCPGNGAWSGCTFLHDRISEDEQNGRRDHPYCRR